MAMLSYEEFLDYVKQWIVLNEAKIAKAWPQKGGWEEWAKTDIYSYIDSQGAYDMLREQHVFTNNYKRADFLLNDQAAAVQDKVIVEVKCQSFENRDEFVPGLEEDIQKLMHEVKPAYQGAALLVFGIYFTNETRALPRSFSYQTLGTGEVGICWAVDLS